MNVIKLSGYSATADVKRLELGTFDSFGIEQLQVIKGDGLEDLSVIATFNPPNKKPVQVVVDSVTGIFDVPKEATEKLYGVGTIVFVGLADGVQRISADVEYIVKKHSNASGTEPAEPTPSVVQQILTEAQNANKTSADAKKLATDAKDIAQSVRTDADEGKFNGKDGAKGDKGDTGATPQLKIDEDNLWQVSYDNGETWVSLGVKATGAAGKDGADGLTPYIGKNGNWWVGDTDTGVSAKGDRGDTGAKGADGVSPTASVTQTDDGAKITVTDANGTTTATIRNGTDGKDGAPGAAGKDAVVDATLTQDGQAADAKVTGEKISHLEEDTAALQKRQNVLVGSETGNPVSCDDAFAAPLCGLNVYGKSTQDGTPTPDAPVPIVSAGDGGTIVLTLGDGDGKTQTLTLSTPNGLPGISVTSGGNYTDQNGQQWICDEVDLERGVKVQRVNVVDLSTCTITGVTNLAETKRIAILLPLVGADYKVEALCNKLQFIVSFTKDEPHFYVDTRNAQIFIPIGAENPKEGEYILFYVLATPIETPLTPAEIAAYKALTAYAPNTVVQASDGAGIKLDYQRDVNLVVKNLEDAIASMTTT